MLARIFVAISLALFLAICIIYKFTNLLYISLNLAVLYDLTYLWNKTNVRKSIILIFGSIIFLFNYYLRKLYFEDRAILIEIIIISQLSDVFQYLCGYVFGKTKIGWLSRNKTYEGYVGGFILTLVSIFLWRYLLVDCILFRGSNIEITYKLIKIFTLGILGGLFSSFFKRSIDIKDYSNLLGPHGGFFDRVDSMFLPSLLQFRLFENAIQIFPNIFNC